MAAETEQVEVYEDKEYEWRWRRRAVNGEIISDSAEGYIDKDHCWKMAERVNPGIPVELIEEI